MPCFCKLSSDSIWGIRKSCAESIVDIAEALALKEREEYLLPVFLNYLKDVIIYLV